MATEETTQKVNPDTNFDDVSDDKVEEYLKTKEAIKTFREDLKELKEEHENFDEAEELAKQLKILRQNINNDENVRIISDKIATLKERLDLLKEIIKVQLKESEQKEIKRDGRKFKLVEILKEMKDEE